MNNSELLESIYNLKENNDKNIFTKTVDLNTDNWKSILLEILLTY